MEPSILFKQTEGACSLCLRLMQACVQAWVYERAACVHILSLQTYPARQMNSSLTPYQCKHLLILPTTYPCHVVFDPLTCRRTYTHINFVCYSIVIRKLHTYPYCTSLGYVLPSHPQCLSSHPVHSDR